uniref:Uncharacterized protein n=1 Tax=Rhizophora mucronata TaxID=61149 RepID=A0A2P2LWE9_RHIMU
MHHNNNVGQNSKLVGRKQRMLDNHFGLTSCSALDKSSIVKISRLSCSQ